MKRLEFAVSVLAVISLTSLGFVYAAGFDNSNVGTRASSMGWAFTGVADDATAVFYNPGGLAFLPPGSDWQIAGLFAFPELNYTTSLETSTSDLSALVPSVFYSKSTGRKAFGFGFYVPYGGGYVRYDDFQQLGYDLIFSGGLPAISCSFAYEFTPEFSFGTSLSIYAGLFQGKGAMNFDYSGIAGYGLNAGIMYKPTSSVTLGFTIRSEVPVEMDGEYNNADSEVTFTLPYYLTAGIGIDINPEALISIDLGFRSWSSMKEVIMIGAPMPMKTYFRDNYYISIGYDQDINESFALQAGIRFEPGATKIEGLNPQTNDVDMLSLSAGFSYQTAGSAEIIGALLYGMGAETTYIDGIGDSYTYDLDYVGLMIGVNIKL